MKFDSTERYRFIRKIGDGGMGEVYLVEHMLLRRQEALKVLHPKLAKSRQFISRLRREARALNRLKHQNIVCVYDFGSLPDGRFYLSVEYAEGDNLRNALKSEGPMSMTQAVSFLMQLASAVGHAHSRGVIHRDLKPENFILQKDQDERIVLKVLDFGIAKIVAPGYQDSVELTKLGSINGTPHYMSPEQVHGDGNDPRIDIYAIGCIGFELVMGVPPFRSPSFLNVMHAQVNDPPPSLDRNKLGSGLMVEEYERIVHTCMAKNPDIRFQTGEEIVEALTRVQEATGAIENTRKVRPKFVTEPLTLDARDGVEFMEDATVEETPQTLIMTPQAYIRTSAVSDSPPGVETLTTELAEHLLALGYDDSSLHVQLCLVREIRTEIEQMLDELEELQRRRAEVEERARNSEARLRFSIGELHFERDRAREQHRDIDAQVMPHIKVLEQRLAMVHSAMLRECEQIDKRETEIQGLYGKRQRVLDRAIGDLRALVTRMVPDHGSQPRITMLLTLLRDRPRDSRSAQ